MEITSVQGSTAFSVIHVKQNGISSSASPPFVKTKLVKNGFLGIKGISSWTRRALVDSQHPKKCGMIRCSFSSSSNDYGSFAGNSSENDADYVNSSVLEAIEVKSGPDEFLIMRDGRNHKCAHNNPLQSQPPDYSLHPAIVLKTKDRTGLLLLIIVSEMPSLPITADVDDVQIAMPTMHQVMKVMIENMEYRVKLVRVTKRIHDTYFAELHLVKFGNEADCFKFDMRPSDAINIAVRCKVPIQVNRYLVFCNGVPIQVNRYLAFCDGVRVLHSAKTSGQGFPSEGLLFADPDRPTEQPCTDTKEFNLLRNMLIATVEERYRDAAFWRDRLSQLRLREIWA